MEAIDALLAVITFLTTPTWHLVVLYVIVLAIVALALIKSWGGLF